MGWIARIRRRRWTMQAQTMELRPPQSFRRQPDLSCHAGASPTAVSLIPATSRLSPRRKPGPIFQRPVFMDPDFRRGDNGEWDSAKSAISNAASLRLSVSAVDLSASAGHGVDRSDSPPPPDDAGTDNGAAATAVSPTTASSQLSRGREPNGSVSDTSHISVVTPAKAGAHIPETGVYGPRLSSG